MNINIQPIGKTQSPIFDWELAKAINAEGVERQVILNKLKREDLKTEEQKNVYDELRNDNFSYPQLMVKYGKQTLLYAIHIINTYEALKIKEKYKDYE